MSCPTKVDCNPLYSAYNSNKRGLALNLKDPSGAAVLDKILETADIFVTSYRTAALKRLGLDYETLHSKHSHLIWGQLNGFGDFGPAKDNAGFDTVAFWARSGAMIDLTEKDTSPINPMIGFGDATTGCSFAAGLIGALYNKQKTGQGCKVMISLFAQAIWSASAGVAACQYGDEYPKTRLIPGSPVMDTYKSSDDIWFYMSVLEPERYNAALLEALGRSDLANDPAYVTSAGSKANAKDMTAMLSAEFAKHDWAWIHKTLSECDIAHELVQHVKDMYTDPQALENKYVVKVRNLDGTESFQAMTPVRFTQSEPKSIKDIEPTVDRQAPLIGEHSIEILQEYGYSQTDIDALIASGAVSCNKL